MGSSCIHCDDPTSFKIRYSVPIAKYWQEVILLCSPYYVVQCCDRILNFTISCLGSYSYPCGQHEYKYITCFTFRVVHKSVDIIHPGTNVRISVLQWNSS